VGTIKRSQFYDMNVHALPDCADSPNTMILEAWRMGYSGICLTSFNPANTFHNYDISSIKDFNVYTGIEIQAESVSKVTKNVARLRDKADIIIIGGGREDVNRSALENGQVDILAHPASQSKPLNHILTKAAANNGVAIDFNIDALTMQKGASRVKTLTAMRLNVRLARKYNAPMIITSGAKSHFDLRGPREMMALGMLMGMTLDEALYALSEVPQAIIRRNLDNDLIMEGIEVVG
jgi:ribonuclease P/MRP protein subunit RPP1